jgi:hypothetical protein
MQFSPFICHLIPLRSKYPPQHPVFKHPQSLSITIKMNIHKTAILPIVSYGYENWSLALREYRETTVFEKKYWG